MKYKLFRKVHLLSRLCLLVDRSRSGCHDSTCVYIQYQVWYLVDIGLFFIQEGNALVKVGISHQNWEEAMELIIKDCVGDGQYKVVLALICA